MGSKFWTGDSRSTVTFNILSSACQAATGKKTSWKWEIELPQAVLSEHEHQRLPMAHVSRIFSDICHPKSSDVTYATLANTECFRARYKRPATLPPSPLCHKEHDRWDPHFKHMSWLVPPPSSHHPEFYDISSRGSLLTFICHYYWEGGQPNIWRLISMEDVNDWGSVSCRPGQPLALC